MASVSNNFINTLNKTLGTQNPKDVANSVLKENVSIGEAIVNVLGATGIAGFKFNIPKSELVKMQSDITDHYTDANRPIQDHIALSPIIITLNGLHGEYFHSVNPIEDTLAKVVPTMRLVAEFLPKISPVTQKIKTDYINKTKEMATKYNVSDPKNLENIDKFQAAKEVTLLNGMDLFKLFQELYKLKSAQTRAFLFFEALWQSKTRFTVETTWKRYNNMVIENLQPLRDENADITDFTVTFKQINYAVTQVTSAKDAVGRLSDMLSKTSVKGVDKGKKVDTI